MSARLARHATSTALAAAVLLLPAPSALAAPPTCSAPGPTTAVENATWPFSLYSYCEDPDFDLLEFTIVSDPEHGTLAVDNGDVFYTPEQDYVGPDQFSFTASDGTDETEPIQVAIVVEPNQPPSCSDLTYSFEVEQGESVSFYPECSDDAFVVDFEVVDQPAHGTVTFDDFDGLVYEAAPGYEGPDGFSFRASDGELESELATVEITVFHNEPPHCVTPINVTVAVNGAVRLDTLPICRDPDGDAYTPWLDAGPAHGVLDVNPPIITYRPNRGFQGVDHIRYHVTDARGAESNMGRLVILVGFDPPPPDRRVPTVGLARDGRQKLKAVRRNGLKLRVSSDEAGLAHLSVWVSKRTARRLKIRPRAQGPVRLGWLTRSVEPGETRLTVELGRKARRRLAHARKVRITVLARVSDLADNVGTDALKTTLRR